ncbi:NAD(P)-dependent dehydrogenase (short-subunit alcohol dehydrogenase family) [Barrientosiimonas humi]|uniref:NAD(P)-dependent dehydrogenase (Short-subunit alcohol dehydrogenase family) n=1 Tax=Barrientosiimonas humi TaxID=999931 RepID=A0A542XGB8_9MICO|nr:oxidoreductase [Barrientosiimonas humi]TQL34866.1 NAD(P)-dependent dehydrogenase (short-subunit alcohol dehydrogenase family) [Barrientosiimonas humi]CAG7571043.1 Rhamnolipids biosynthesis 3-oxoacyl-[acyl-carrier-protein] reductase [Barrientosiimonas humi]
MAMTSPWTPDRIPDLTGRHAVVTGGNSGLGQVAATHLAARGATVTLAVRDVSRGERAASAITGDVRVRQLDLASLDSVRAFAADWSEPIDILLNNAGIMMVPQGRTADGFELQLGTNHLGHFALTLQLLPHLRDRVVTVSSQAHRRGRIALDDLHWEQRAYDPAGAYAQAKLANLLFTLELARRLEGRSSVRSLAAHPGYSATNLQNHSGKRGPHVVMQLANRFIARDAEAGTEPLLFAAVEDIPSGSYVGPAKAYECRGQPTLVGRSPAASNVELAKEFWLRSATEVGLSPELTLG